MHPVKARLALEPHHWIIQQRDRLCPWKANRKPESLPAGVVATGYRIFKRSHNLSRQAGGFAQLSSVYSWPPAVNGTQMPESLCLSEMFLLLCSRSKRRCEIRSFIICSAMLKLIGTCASITLITLNLSAQTPAYYNSTFPSPAQKASFKCPT